MSTCLTKSRMHSNGKIKSDSKRNLRLRSNNKGRMVAQETINNPLIAILLDRVRR